MNSYFTYDFDDCFRRVVTSAENLFEARGWRWKPASGLVWLRLLRLFGLRFKEKPNTFRRALSHNVRKNRLSGEVINENMQFIYTVRN